MKIKGSLLISISIVKRLRREKWMCHLTCKYRVADYAIFGTADPNLPTNYTTFMAQHIVTGWAVALTCCISHSANYREPKPLNQF